MTRPCVVVPDRGSVFVGEIWDERHGDDEPYYQVRRLDTFGMSWRHRWFPEHCVTVWDTEAEAREHLAGLQSALKAYDRR